MTMKRHLCLLLAVVVLATIFVALPAFARDGAITLQDGSEHEGNIQFVYRKKGILGLGAEEFNEEYLEAYLLGQSDRIRVDFTEIASIDFIWPDDDRWQNINDEDIDQVALRAIAISQAPIYLVVTTEDGEETIYRISGYFYNTKYLNEVWVRHGGANIERYEVFSSGGALFAPPEEEQIDLVVFD